MQENLEKLHTNDLNILNNGMKGIDISEEKIEGYSKMYCIYKDLNVLCFDTVEELLDYRRLNGLLSNPQFTIEYIGDFKDKHDVILEKVRDKKIYITRRDEDSYYMYSEEKSKIASKPIWHSTYGSIDDMYMEFKKRGIEFTSEMETPKVKKQVLSKSMQELTNYL